ncbi:MAG: hypothetical protein CMI79_04635 [Candidatus Pelagibacter sp.]|nr:hypothetical protein [Candidatus Pelagibacter sp.]
MNILFQIINNFIKSNSKLILIPIIVGMILIVALLILNQGSKIIPFIYTFF